ncbi:AtpZ/AtpI family protein [Emticicia sp. C21]|uniref:AtpZ/AtpI family protein n=1 Tax=Emticicia sp. C21 TaxID=2302915 RepID=UPI000E354921|nr:AtpZ/AtpI family protein [Emticicia sp. C21]RFS17941.1 AtpZ/AtpI family protein [Emticicia sp. C21]
MEENNDMKNTKTWLKFTQIGLQMILTIGLGTWFGYWLDERVAHKTPVWTLVLSLTSIGVSLYNVIRQLPKQ